MTVGYVNVKSTIELLIVVIQMLFDRQSMNSTNSSLSPSSDNKSRSRGKDKKRYIMKQN